jgi:hypothetical protein
MAKFGSFAKFRFSIGFPNGRDRLWGFANLPNVGWRRNLKKWEVGEIIIFSFHVEWVLKHSPVSLADFIPDTFLSSVSLSLNVLSSMDMPHIKKLPACQLADSTKKHKTTSSPIAKAKQKENLKKIM